MTNMHTPGIISEVGVTSSAKSGAKSSAKAVAIGRSSSEACNRQERYIKQFEKGQ